MSDTTTTTGSESARNPLGWIVGVDDSDCSRHAAEWAIVQAQGRTDRVKLVSAWQIPSAPALPSVGPMRSYWDVEAFETATKDTVEQLAASLRSDAGTVAIETQVVLGQSASVLLDEERDSELLVVGNRGRGGFSRLVLGSTSTQCATHGTVPTAVIPSAAEIAPARHLVVGVDGSQTSLDAVAWAVSFAAPGSTVECVNVWDVTPIAVGADQFFFPEASDLASERFDHQLDSLLARLDIDADRGITVERRFVEGRPRQDLAEAANDCDLFVMGARGHGAIGSAILGSISTWLLHHVERPMVVVPHAPDRSGAGDSE